jgi:hypothetical protein
MKLAVPKFGAAALLCALGLAVSCGEPTKPSSSPAAAKAAPEVPAELQHVAETVLGSESEVLVYGDLARTRRQEALVINRLKSTPQGTVPGTLVTRVVVVESDGGTWKEVFRCDEHLKNTHGYLAATPMASVTAWRLQYEQHEDKGLVMYFTPLAQPAGGYIQTIGVRWNPEVKRYQSLDRTFEHFLGETPALETPQVRLSK